MHLWSTFLYPYAAALYVWHSKSGRHDDEPELQRCRPTEQHGELRDARERRTPGEDFSPVHYGGQSDDEPGEEFQDLR